MDFDSGRSDDHFDSPARAVFYPTWDAANLLAELDLPPDRKLKQLSRGMRMKAALASVLAFRPSLIVMDEPFSGLDPLVRDELIKALLDRMNDEYEAGHDSGTTILISSYELAEVESFAIHVAFLHRGKLLFAESYRCIRLPLCIPMASSLYRGR
jgi:ABC-2 type transport system ATP-binding protein